MKFYDPARLKHMALLVLGGAVLAPALAWGLGTITTGYKTTTSNTAISAHSVCKNVKHTGGAAYFIPTKSATEWAAFRSNVPGGLTVSNCQNWYAATNAGGGSCTAVCSAAGKSSTANAFGSVCASGENRPIGESANISYIYGTWGPEANRVNSVVNANVCTGGGRDGPSVCTPYTYCYYSGQVRDQDGSDYLVSCHCE